MDTTKETGIQYQQFEKESRKQKRYRPIVLERVEHTDMTQTLVEVLWTDCPSFAKQTSALDMSRYNGLMMPPDFVKKYMNPLIQQGVQHPVTLEDIQGRKFPGIWKYETQFRGLKPKIKTGWKEFTERKRVEEGDTILAELVAKDLLRIKVLNERDSDDVDTDSESDENLSPVREQETVKEEEPEGVQPDDQKELERGNEEDGKETAVNEIQEEMEEKNKGEEEKGEGSEAGLLKDKEQVNPETGGEMQKTKKKTLKRGRRKKALKAKRMKQSKPESGQEIKIENNRFRPFVCNECKSDRVTAFRASRMIQTDSPSFFRRLSCHDINRHEFLEVPLSIAVQSMKAQIGPGFTKKVDLELGKKVFPVDLSFDSTLACLKFHGKGFSAFLRKEKVQEKDFLLMEVLSTSRVRATVFRDEDREGKEAFVMETNPETSEKQKPPTGRGEKTKENESEDDHAAVTRTGGRSVPYLTSCQIARSAVGKLSRKAGLAVHQISTWDVKKNCVTKMAAGFVSLHFPGPLPQQVQMQAAGGRCFPVLLTPIRKSGKACLHGLAVRTLLRASGMRLKVNDVSKLEVSEEKVLRLTLLRLNDQKVLEEVRPHEDE